jgi:hypothetical protein
MIQGAASEMIAIGNIEFDGDNENPFDDVVGSITDDAFYDDGANESVGAESAHNFSNDDNVSVNVSNFSDEGNIELNEQIDQDQNNGAVGIPPVMQDQQNVINVDQSSLEILKNFIRAEINFLRDDLLGNFQEMLTESVEMIREVAATPAANNNNNEVLPPGFRNIPLPLGNVDDFEEFCVNLRTEAYRNIMVNFPLNNYYTII